ncbi:hypothetical protein [Streptomyces sp. SID4982]|uniref:hypothetical protein n=1 Tax=Streptomyces sp. SID4982 TaxID=2690291 RepID=UPI00192957B8|nr:hypothetical protein [Streptomyces sp. SID4982]
MARIRTIKPEFFTSLTIADLPLTARLTFIGLWTHADDAGRCIDDPRLIKAALWPLDDRTASDIETDLKLLSESSLITRYVLNQKRYLAVTGWDEHQRINRPTASKLPAPDEGEPLPPDPVTRENSDSLSTHTQLTEGSPQERKGREGNREGKGTPLPPASHQPPVSPPEGPSETTRSAQMTEDWWQQYGRRTAQTKRTVRQAIAEALANGIESVELRAALDRLGETSKPVTGGTLQFALSDVRRPSLRAVPTTKRHQHFEPPTDPSVYQNGFDFHARPHASGE